MIIGLDHGYGLIKTVNTVFMTGITRYEHEPYTLKNTLLYNGDYYVCGSNRQAIIREKTQDDSYFLLTLAALAGEVNFRSGAHEANIVLAAGLPLTRFGLDKQKFKEYLMRSPQETHSFEFEGKPYSIRIKDVLLYPQGYAAVIHRIRELKKEPSVVICDIGSWTVDVMRLDNGIPNAEYCRSLELGMIRCISEISEQIRRSAGLSVTDTQIENILFENRCLASGEISRIAIQYGKAYAGRIVSALLENGFDIKAVPVIFLGGGAAFMERCIPKEAVCSVQYITDIHANAKGYEQIAKQAYPDE